MSPANTTRSLRRLLLAHELALLFLIIVTGALGYGWGYFWQETSDESVRLNELAYTAQRIRSDLFRQIKEVTLARLMEDPAAMRLYRRYSRRIDKQFNTLRQNSQTRSEGMAIQELQLAYRVIQKDMNAIFTDPYVINRTVRMRILNPSYEKQMVGGFEKAFSGLDEVLEATHAKLHQRRALWSRLAPLLMPVPVLLAVALLLTSRRSVQEGFVRPMADLIGGAKQIREGNLRYQVPVCGAAEVANLAEALNQMAKDLAQSRDALVEKEKQVALGSLVPVVAHNVRNPLASMRASAQLLEHAEGQNEISEIKHDLIQTVDRLGRWINALVSYLHPLQPHFVHRDPRAVLDAVLGLLSPKIEQKRLRIEKQGWELEHELLMDVDLTEQAFYGLLSNAVDASPPLGQMRLRLRQSDTALEIAIEDEGPGMPFQPQPSDLRPGPSTKRFGTGLGIPVAYKIFKAHGWELHFMNRSHGGNRVLVEARPKVEP
ncbi:MAG: ATP-binding protein [Gammaproteobacteria bacterium]